MFKIGPNMTKIKPKFLKIRQIAPKKPQNVQKLLQKFYSRQKAREFPSKSYCWSSNLLGTSCLGAATICSSVGRNQISLLETSCFRQEDYGFVWPLTNKYHSIKNLWIFKYIHLTLLFSIKFLFQWYFREGNIYWYTRIPMCLFLLAEPLCCFSAHQQQWLYMVKFAGKQGLVAFKPNC